MFYDFILFDLDGTLTDSAEGIVNSVVYALEQKGIPYVNKQELRRFVGPPLQASFRDYCGFSEEEAKEMDLGSAWLPEKRKVVMRPIGVSYNEEREVK